MREKIFNSIFIGESASILEDEIILSSRKTRADFRAHFGVKNVSYDQRKYGILHTLKFIISRFYSWQVYFCSEKNSQERDRNR